MEIAEIRDLDGPNLFMLRPAVKLEIDAQSGTPVVAESAAKAFVLGDGDSSPECAPVSSIRLEVLLAEVVNVLHDRSGVDRPHIVTRAMETPNHVAVAFTWTNRPFARALARTAFDIVSGTVDGIDARIEELANLASKSPSPADLPEMRIDSDRILPIVGITGTNGKTTTTRLIASILMQAGKRVGWTSSAGVYVQDECVLAGDFTGPAGAARVFEEPGLDVGVLETARGGILLRGLGYQSNDVSVVTNVSADHLGLQGVFTVEELARVKQVVAAVTRPDGFAVLNAGDPLVLAMREVTRARPFLISSNDSNPEVETHRADGGWALWVANGQVHFSHDGVDEVLTDLNDIPISFGGRAVHMLENALCGAAATLALGLDLDQVRSGLARFRNKSDQNRGRLNVFDVDGITVIVDFAHNAAGLKHLLTLGRSMTSEGGKLIAAVGSAGDRPDDALMELGRIAAAQADIVIAKDTLKYLRGRQPGDILELILRGVAETSHMGAISMPNEYAAFERSMDFAKPGDTVAIMCIEDIDQILDRLETTGTSVS